MLILLRCVAVFLLCMHATAGAQTVATSFAAPAGPAPLALSASVLSEQERAYLASLPELRVALPANPASPYEKISPDGVVTGIQADLLASLARAFGLRIRPISFPDWPSVLAAVRDGQADMVLTIASTAERRAYMAFTLGTVEVPLAMVGRAGEAVANLEVANYALEREYFNVDLVQRRYPNATITEVANTSTALSRVASKQADLYLGSLLEVVDSLARDPVPGLEVKTILRGGPGFYRFGLRRELAPLVTILNKGISNWRLDTEAVAAQSSALLASAASGLTPPPTLALSRAEADVLVAHPLWRVGAVRGLTLLNDVSANGRHTGIAADYVEHISQRLGIEVELVVFDSVAEMLDGLRQDRLDLIPLLTYTPERASEFSYSSSFVQMPYVLVGATDGTLYWDLQSLRGKRLALPPQHPLRAMLAREFPDVQVVDVGSGFEAMRAVLRGEAEAAVEVKLYANLYINDEGIGRLRVLGTVPEVSSDFHMATSKQSAALLPLVDRVLADISPEESQRLYRRWVAVDLRPSFDWHRWLPAMVASGLSLLLLLAAAGVWVRRQATELSLRRLADEQLDDIGRTMPGVAFRYLLDSNNQLDDTFYSSGTKQFLGVAPRRRATLLDIMSPHLNPEQRASLGRAQQHSLQTGERFSQKVLYAHPQGPKLWLQVESTRSTTADGRTAWTGYVVDISAERALQERLSHEAEQRHLMLASASHELRAPAHTLSLALQSLDERELPVAAQGALHIAKDATQTLSLLLDDVLDAARLNAGKLEIRPRDFDLQALLAQVIRAHETVMAQRGLAFVVQLAPDLPEQVHADPLRLKQLLMNLLSNAAKYTQMGQVSLRVLRQAGEQPDTQRLLFEVQDTGIGIDEEQQARVFEPFASIGAKPPEDAQIASSGLGLSICRRLLQLMDGQIELHSALGQGTTVRFWIPLAHARASVKPLRQTGLVLLCDDDPVSRLLMSEALLRLGFETAQAESGEQALARWRQGDVRILLTDLDMPGLSGMALMTAIRAAEADAAFRTGIVICSGDQAPKQGSGEPLPAFDAFVSKPVNLADLRATLEGILGTPNGHEDQAAAGSTAAPAPSPGNSGSG